MTEFLQYSPDGSSRKNLLIQTKQISSFTHRILAVQKSLNVPLDHGQSRLRRPSLDETTWDYLSSVDVEPHHDQKPQEQE